MYPSYLSLGSKEIKKRGFELYNRLSNCDICPRECKVNRIMGQKGVAEVIIDCLYLHITSILEKKK
jgi:uncharacterized Fe-S radical SAM superfamily protein PflX